MENKDINQNKAEKINAYLDSKLFKVSSVFWGQFSKVWVTPSDQEKLLNVSVSGLSMAILITACMYGAQEDAMWLKMLAWIFSSFPIGMAITSYPVQLKIKKHESIIIDTKNKVLWIHFSREMWEFQTYGDAKKIKILMTEVRTTIEQILSHQELCDKFDYIELESHLLNRLQLEKSSFSSDAEYEEQKNKKYNQIAKKLGFEWQEFTVEHGLKKGVIFWIARAIQLRNRSSFSQNVTTRIRISTKK